MATTYKFSSKASGDLLMMEDVGTRLLRIIGKDVTAQGIIEVAAMPRAAHALAAAVAEDESRLAQIKGDLGAEESEQTDVDSVTLRQHVWPFVEMTKQAQAAGEVKLKYSFRLNPVMRLFDLPAPEQS